MEEEAWKFDNGVKRGQKGIPRSGLCKLLDYFHFGIFDHCKLGLGPIVPSITIKLLSKARLPQLNLSQAFSILLPIPQLDLPPLNFPSLSHGGVNKLTEGLIQEKPTLTPSAIHSIALPPEIRTKINAHSHKLMPHVLGLQDPSGC